MGGDHHHHGPPKVPDYKIYRVEDIPELMQTKKALASMGLKDNWMRNEVWKYMHPVRRPPYEIFKRTMGRGMAIGFGLAVVTAIIEKTFFTQDHGHGGGHDEAHH